MGLDLDIPAAFETIGGDGDDDGAMRPIVVRDGLDGARVQPLLAQVFAVDWPAVHHAYGPAGDVPAQLAAAIVGDDATRKAAWWSLWSNVLHQGTVYEATVPAVPILAGLGRWSAYPDRAEALEMLRMARAAPGVVVWRYAADGDLVHLEDEARRLLPELRGALADATTDLVGGWRDEPPEIQRVLLWILSVDPELRARHQDLVDAILPAEHRAAWALAIADAIDTEEQAWTVYALEDWVHGVDAG